MKRLLLAALVGLTALPALPAVAKETPRCERQDRHRDCPPQAGREGKGPRHHNEGRPAPRHAGDDRRAEPGRDWQPGQTYKGRGDRIDHRRADLPRPPRGQHWIRDGERYLLVSDGSGVIRHVMARALR
ncbi:RcnB family protein [Paracoccus fontiphilus]|uniref:RcnB family protein n=1 Tax=Paracoccus fontiphilus TaxID=1815556 RepID=A0ABV7IDC3_9RHOB|nr:RcnB family protein [Paracoccus fontiphilus]